MYRYFVSFICHQYGMPSYGNTFATLPLPIDSRDEIEFIEKQIAKEKGISKVIINNFILVKEEPDKPVCLHCAKNEAKYCEICYQDLLSKNAALQLEIVHTRENVRPVTYNPYATDFPRYGIDLADGSDKHIEDLMELSQWKKEDKPKPDYEPVVEAIKEWAKSQLERADETNEGRGV